MTKRIGALRVMTVSVFKRTLNHFSDAISIGRHCRKKHVMKFMNLTGIQFAYNLMAHTAHRPVGGIAHDRELIDLGTFDIGNHGMGMMLISDKAVTNTHMYRLIILSPPTVQMVKAYEADVEITQRALHRVDPGSELPAKLGTLLRADINSQLPFISFYDEESDALVELKPAHIKQYLSTPEKPYQHRDNVGRTLYSTALTELGCPADLISSLMGHLSGGTHPFGKYSALSTELFGRQVLPYLTEMTAQFDSPAMDKPIASRKTIEPSANRPVEEYYGSDRRSDTRKAQDKKMSDDVVELLSKHDQIDDTLLEELTNTLKTHAKQFLFGFRRLYKKFKEQLNLRIKDKLITMKTRFRGLHFPHEQACPFHRNTFVNARNALRLRFRFMQYLASLPHDQLDAQLRYAQIIISLILHGRVTSRTLLKPLIKHCHNGYRIIRQDLCIELPAKHHANNIHRIIIDCWTRHLYDGLYRVFPNPPSPDTKKIYKHMQTLLVEGLKLKKSAQKNPDNLIHSLLTFLHPIRRDMRDLNSVHLPGYLAEHHNGSTPSVSVSQKNLQRLLSPKNLASHNPIGETANA